MTMEEIDRRSRFSFSHASCFASTIINVSFTISAGCTFTGRNGNSSHALLPVSPAMPRGVASSRMNTTPTRNIHFQYFASSFRSTCDTTIYSTAPMHSAAACTSTSLLVCI